MRAQLLWGHISWPGQEVGRPSPSCWHHSTVCMLTPTIQLRYRRTWCRLCNRSFLQTANNGTIIFLRTVSSALLWVPLVVVVAACSHWSFILSSSSESSVHSQLINSGATFSQSEGSSQQSRRNRFWIMFLSNPPWLIKVLGRHTATLQILEDFTVFH